ncbi:MAG: type II toxin-antitoxin system HipA family toxin [Pseudomonadota bacterium]
MNIDVLRIALGDQRVGQLFRFQPETAEPILRFVADEAFERLPLAQAQVLSIGMRAADADTQRAVWRDIQAPHFNARRVPRPGGGADWQLPAWFQGLLPEGVFRDFVARAAGCAPDDHFRMLAACGKDLPGKVSAVWETVEHAGLQRLVTQDQDALEMNVTADPVQDAISLSGVQPKLAVVREGDRYVGRTKLQDTHVIAKLPAADHARMPQVEHLSLTLAQVAGVATCAHALEPLDRLLAVHDYDLGDEAQPHFLAVERFDRSPAGRIHVETMAQVFDVPPAFKYTRSYLEVAALLLRLPLCGEAAVHELLRRLAVNELLGNFDAHLANWGLIYRNGIDPELSPAYDIVAHAAWLGAGSGGHALRILPEAAAGGVPQPQSILRPATVRRFCDLLRLPVTPAATVVRRTAAAAHRLWPALITASGLTPRQKQALSARLAAAPGGAQGRPRTA